MIIVKNMIRLLCILAFASLASTAQAQAVLSKDQLAKLMVIFDKHSQPSTIERDVAKALRLRSDGQDAPLRNISIEDNWGAAALYRAGMGYVFGRADNDGTRLFHADAQLRLVAAVVLSKDGMRQLSANEGSAGLARELGVWAAVAGSL